MGPKILASTLCLALLLASGCTTPDARTSDASTPPPTSTGDASLSHPAPGVATPKVLHSSAFVMAGQTRAGACVFSITGAQCQMDEGRDDFREVQAEGTPARLRGNLSWTPSHEGLPGLQVYLLHKDNGTWTFDQGDPFAAGTSPLLVDFPLNRTSPMAVAISQFTGTSIVVGYAGVFTPQEFRFNGTLEWRE